MSISLVYRVLFYLCLFCYPLFGATHQPNAYERRLVAIQIDYDIQNHHVKGVITLDNGSKWIWYPCCNNCADDLNAWDIADEIRILSVVNGKYELYNCAHAEFQPNVEIDASTIDVFPTIYAIDQKGQSVMLSDGSEWFVGWWSALWAKNWNIGDPVIVTPDAPNHGYSTHKLFNMNKEKKEKALSDNSYINAMLSEAVKN